MSDTRSRFEARDLSPPGFCKGPDGREKYIGPERRRSNRRSNGERRATVRFAENKVDRRQLEGRREGDRTPKFW
ncbi:hypothetical protein [Kineobactrum salinum]|uniref:Uncharacterized protein n=1 Tax=Kineobactrum salinum TaxID=2708301 RepID=A0A6C0U1C8_9GAMM|nr:hypothetical protein [Kineobactrum salinum]QIB64787.1 hypothetical protein G3T16_04675 [Kineobactrum salinum]